jgi:F420-non-reducing hydrogenase iron-sulfur subunit
MREFSPKIIGFACNWCCYAGADLAGTSRMKYPPNLRLIRVMCSGRIDPQFILRAFKEGADGIFIGGCHPGDCHYVSGNYKAEKRIDLLKGLLAGLGIEPERLELRWVSASEGQIFADAVTEFTDRIRKLGPLALDAPPPVYQDVAPEPEAPAPAAETASTQPPADADSEKPDLGHLKAVPDAGQFASRIPEFKIPDGA